MSNIYRCVMPIPQIHHKFIDYKDAGRPASLLPYLHTPPKASRSAGGEPGTCPPTVFARGEAGGKTC